MQEISREWIEDQLINGRQADDNRAETSVLINQQDDYEAWCHEVVTAMPVLVAAMEPDIYYRYNAPTLETAVPDGYIRTAAINRLLDNGMLVKMDRTSNQPPFLMLASK